MTLEFQWIVFLDHIEMKLGISFVVTRDGDEWDQYGFPNTTLALHEKPLHHPPSLSATGWDPRLSFLQQMNTPALLPSCSGFCFVFLVSFLPLFSIRQVVAIWNKKPRFSEVISIELYFLHTHTHDSNMDIQV